MKNIYLDNFHKFSNAKKESFRVIKTNIQFSGDDVKVILITSSAPDEGKSTVSMDLAVSFAESDKKVLIIDTDMRKSVLVGRLHAHIEGDEEIVGLSHYLAGQKKVEDVIYHNEGQGIDMLFAGHAVPNPTELLEKKYFEKLIQYGRDNYDYVIIDCAPVGAAIDAAMIAKLVDGAILVIAQGQEHFNMINGVVKQIKASGVKILGAILNKVETSKNSYGYGYGSYYGKYYSEEE